MARKKAEKTKRDSEVHIQFWLDTENPAHKAALDIWRDYRKNNTPIDIFIEGMYSLQQIRGETNVTLPDYSDYQRQRVDLLVSMVTNINTLLSTGGATFTPQAQQQISQFAQDMEELSGVEQAAARSYRTVNFEDENE